MIINIVIICPWFQPCDDKMFSANDILKKECLTDMFPVKGIVLVML